MTTLIRWYRSLWRWVVDWLTEDCAKYWIGETDFTVQLPETVLLVEPESELLAEMDFTVQLPETVLLVEPESELLVQITEMMLPVRVAEMVVPVAFADVTACTVVVRGGGPLPPVRE